MAFLIINLQVKDGEIGMKWVVNPDSTKTSHNQTMLSGSGPVQGFFV